MIDLKHLRSFIAVEKHRHFGKAAESLFVSNATMSGRIKELEHALGEPVFQRTSRQVDLTDFGAEFLAGLRGPMMALGDLLESVATEATGERARVGLGVGTDRGLILAALAAVRRDGIALETELLYEDAIAARLRAKDLDVGVVWSTPDQLGLEDLDLISVLFATVECYAVVAEDGPFAELSEMTAESIGGAPLVLFRREFAPGPYDLFLRFARQNDRSPNIASLEPSQEAMARATLAFPDAVTFITSDTARTSVQSGYRTMPCSPRIFTNLYLTGPESKRSVLAAIASKAAATDQRPDD